MKILIAAKSPDELKIASLQLQSHEVVYSSDFQSACEHIRKENFDMLVTELRLPLKNSDRYGPLDILGPALILKALKKGVPAAYLVLLSGVDPIENLFTRIGDVSTGKTVIKTVKAALVAVNAQGDIIKDPKRLNRELGDRWIKDWKSVFEQVNLLDSLCPGK